MYAGVQLTHSLWWRANWRQPGHSVQTEKPIASVKSNERLHVYLSCSIPQICPEDWEAASTRSVRSTSSELHYKCIEHLSPKLFSVSNNGRLFGSYNRSCRNDASKEPFHSKPQMTSPRWLCSGSVANEMSSHGNTVENKSIDDHMLLTSP